MVMEMAMVMICLEMSDIAPGAWNGDNLGLGPGLGPCRDHDRDHDHDHGLLLQGERRGTTLGKGATGSNGRSQDGNDGVHAQLVHRRKASQ